MQEDSQVVIIKISEDPHANDQIIEFGSIHELLDNGWVPDYFDIINTFGPLIDEVLHCCNKSDKASISGFKIPPSLSFL